MRSLEQRLGEYPDEVILACVNYGYVASGIVENWAISIARVGLGDQVLIVTLDDRAQAVLNSRGLPACRWNSGLIQNPSEEHVTFSKLQLVHEALRLEKDVLFSDADIVFKENPLPLLRSLAAPVAVQSDVPVAGSRDDDWSKGTLCSGFFLARSCEETIRIFDGNRDDVERFERDQLLLHHRLIVEREAATVILPRQLFPNGSYWREKRPVDPYAIHYNWCRGLDRKIQWMKEDGNWQIDGEAGEDAGVAGAPGTSVLVAAHFGTHAGEPGSCSLNEYAAVFSQLRPRVPCNLLVFGVGNDSRGWREVNRGGRTVFLEDNPGWIQQVRARVPDTEIVEVSYPANLAEATTLLKANVDRRFAPELTVRLPQCVRSESWDLIFVDAPLGAPGGPGRHSSIYTAKCLAGDDTVVAVHDCDRPLERLACDLLLSPSRPYFEVGRMRVYF